MQTNVFENSIDAGALSAGGASRRDAILCAAADLFYRCGVAAVSVDQIAKLARTHKMTVYRMYGSKDALVDAYVEFEANRAVIRYDNLMSRFPSRRPERIAAFFRGLADEISSPGYSGDPLLKLSTTFPDCRHDVRLRIGKHHQMFREKLRGLAADCLKANFNGLGDAWYLLWTAIASPSNSADEFMRYAESLPELAIRLAAAFRLDLGLCRGSDEATS